MLPCFPKITIVTPSYNQGGYLGDTIESVLGQGYPNLEYIIMDGGSTDNSVEVIKKYEKHLTYWCSKRDGGQSASVNEAFGRATGDILAWLNSDDFYFPGTLKHVAEKLNTDKEEILLGNCFHFTEGAFKVAGSNIVKRHATTKLELIDYVIQPSSFWTKKLWDRVGQLESKWGYVFDWDWYIRAQKSGAEFKTTQRYLAAYRIHAQHKSGTGGERRAREIREVYEKHTSERILRLHDTCQKNYHLFKKIRKRAKGYKLSKLIDENQLLKLLFPGALKGMETGEIQAVLDMVSPF